LSFAKAQEKSIILVAEVLRYSSCSDDRIPGEIAGFTWGYLLPFAKFPFLEGKVARDSSYIDEVAVDKTKRLSGVGRALCNSYREIARQQGIEQLVLRTNISNTASVGLFTNIGFRPIYAKEREGFHENDDLKVFDPDYSDRFYFERRVGESVGEQNDR